MLDNMSQNQGMQNYQYQNKEQRVENKTAPSPNNMKFNFSFKKQEDADVELRKPRSRAYMEVLEAIDLLSATDEEIIAKLKESMDEETFEEFSEMSVEDFLEEIKATFQEEFQKVKKEHKMVGVIARCCIGGCDCHEISPTGEIVVHYSRMERLSMQYEYARELLAKHSDCMCVEIYSDCCRVIDFDGSVNKVSGNNAGF